LQNKIEINTERQGGREGGINKQYKVLNIFAIVKHETISMF